MSDANEGFVSRIKVIESQPLDRRAEAYQALHDELARALESGVPRQSTP